MVGLLGEGKRSRTIRWWTVILLCSTTSPSVYFLLVTVDNDLFIEAESPHVPVT